MPAAAPKPTATSPTEASVPPAEKAGAAAVEAVVAAAATETAGDTAVEAASVEAPVEAPAATEAASVDTETVAEAVADEGAADVVSSEIGAISDDKVASVAAVPIETAAVETTAKTTDEAAAVEATSEAAADEPVADNAPEAATTSAAAPTAEAIPDAPEISEHLQKRLDTYFARLRQDFPDGRITRLNTAHKKLAERGAELRRLIGYEGRLDEFFALGGFTYQRGVSGRPTLPAAQTASVEDRLRQQFPEDVPTLLAVQQADHRLYLDLRAAARRAGCTVGEYLDQFRAG